MTLPALQAYVARAVAERGFTTDLTRVLVLLVEEVGELATEFKHRVFHPDRFDPRNLSHELADVLLYLCDLANGFGVDLAGLWPKHERANDERFAARREGRPAGAHVAPELTVNDLVAHVEAKRAERGFEDTPERLVMLLTEEVGEVAHEVRRHWTGQADTRHAGMEIIDALTYVFRLCFMFGVDCEAAVVEKERQNASRTWHY